uniref:Recoverin 3 n=1 Tax=Sinocyclocheilus rhinocerous TaxID=307959 RepID=A0A673FQW4_9TELE
MGNAQSGGIPREILDDLKLTTRFSDSEITQWYENFQKQCPTGRITLQQFEEIYAYAQHVFRSFDTNDDGTLDFKEYVVALHMTSSGKSTLKLEWAFSLFDVDKNGYVTKPEVTELSQAIFDLIPKEKQANLPSDESTPEKRAEKLWRKHLQSRFSLTHAERVAEGEFIQAIQSNEAALRLIQYDHK